MTLPQAVRAILKQCIGLKKTESLLIVTDKKRKRIANALFDIGRGMCRNAMIVVIPEGRMHGEEPPTHVAELMKRFDVVIAPTTKSITHTLAVRNARKKGKRARIATMPGITEDVLARGMSVNYKKIKKRSSKINSALEKSGKIRITTKKGTDITLIIDKNAGLVVDTGIIHQKGMLTNLPAGEAGFVPLHGKAEGVFVADASIGGIGRLRRPVRITVKKGRAAMIEGGKEAVKLRKMLKKCGKNSGNIAELGIGTNPGAKISGIVLEDEKVVGTAHIALGNSKGLGGKIYAKCHLDCVFKKPTIYAGKRIIMKAGKLAI